jgi:AcrR family transcriptional regulator
VTPQEVARRQRARKGEGDLLRADILSAAEQLLHDTGSEDAVSIRAVADAVGVTPPSIYRHFPDKTHLLFEVCMSTWNGLADRVSAAVVEGDLEATLRAQARAYVHFGVENPEHYRIMFMTPVDVTPEQFRQEMFAPETAFALFLETVEALRTSGLVRPEIADLGTVTMGLHLWAAVHGITSLLTTKPMLPWDEVDTVIDQQLDLLINGLLPRP